MDFTEISFRKVQLEIEGFLDEVNAWLRGDGDVFERVLYRDRTAPRLARDFVFVRDGEQLDHHNVVERLRGLAAKVPEARLKLVDLEVRQAGHGACVVLCALEDGPSHGFVLTLVLSETPAGLKAVHAHASEFRDVHRVIPDRLGRHRIDPDVVGLLPRNICTERVCLPLSRSGAMLRVALAEPDETTIDDLAFITGFRIEAILEDRDAILLAVERYRPYEPIYEAET